MQTATTAATALSVAAHLPAYKGPLARFLQQQAQAHVLHQDVLHKLRTGIMAVLAETALFSDAERLRANDSVYQCSDVARLQRWFCNVHQVYEERKSALFLPFADGSGLYLPVQPLMWIAS